MTNDLEAINVLSEQFKEAVDRQRPYSEHADAIVIPASLADRGQKVLRMYEAEVAQAPGDRDVKLYMAQHLYYIAYMHYRAYNPILFDGSAMGNEQAEHLQSLCHHAYLSYELFPNSGAASILAEAFRMVKFYGTAIHWLKQAEGNATTADMPDTATKAKAQRLELQMDDKTTDSLLTLKRSFPTLNTPGLQLELQPVGVVSALDKAPASQNGAIPKTGGGCILVLTLLLLASYASITFAR